VVIVDGLVAPGWAEVGVAEVLGVVAGVADLEAVLVALEAVVLAVVVPVENGNFPNNYFKAKPQQLHENSTQCFLSDLFNQCGECTAFKFCLHTIRTC
jgi:hypothetical protein